MNLAINCHAPDGDGANAYCTLVYIDSLPASEEDQPKVTHHFSEKSPPDYISTFLEDKYGLT